MEIQLNSTNSKLQNFIEVKEWAHVSKAQREAARRATEIGFSETAVAEISIIVSELAENLISHHAVDGKIILSKLTVNEQIGLQIIAEDRGPGIENINRAITDGYSENASLGIGLGAVKRLSDEFEVISKTKRVNRAIYENYRENIGTIVISRKWLNRDHPHKYQPGNGYRFGIMSRPKIGETSNGDSWFLKEFNGQVMIAVFDGLGHGEDAAIASLKACAVLNANFEEPLDKLLHRVHVELHRTRGAVGSIALINEKAAWLEYAGIGNIWAQVFNAPQPVRPVNFNGILGSNLEKVKVFHFAWHKGNILMMSSDGISDKFTPDSYPGLLTKHPMIIADLVLRDYGRNSDDATVIVAG